MLRYGDLEDAEFPRRLEWFARIAEIDSPLTARLARAAAHDPVCHRIMSSAPVGIPPANVILAGVQYLLLGGEGPELAAHYPSIAGGEPAGDVGEAFLRFCADHEDRLSELAATRGVQTNEVRRCTGLVPCFTSVARGEARPLALIEVGPSAGLNLCFDRYAYDYGFARTGPEGSPLTLDTEVRAGRPPVPDVLPDVAWRAGIDLNPIDLGDPDAVRWARALLWPDQLDRIARFETATALVAPDPPRIVKGDAVEGIGALIDEAPEGAAVLVYHSFVLNQFDADAKQRFRDGLRTASRDRTVHEIGIGARGWERDRAPHIDHTRYDRGKATEEELGVMHHHGAWIEWRDSQPATRNSTESS